MQLSLEMNQIVSGPVRYWRSLLMDLTVYSSSSPINTNGGSYTAADDFASQSSWQKSVGGNLSQTDIISAGVYFSTGSFSISGLTAAEGDSNQYVKHYCSHNYPQSQSTANLPQLMNHSAIARQISPFKKEIAAAQGKGKPHIMGETNSGINLLF